MPIRLNNLPGLISQADQAGSRAKARPAGQAPPGTAEQGPRKSGASTEGQRAEEAVVVARRAEPASPSQAAASRVSNVDEGVGLARELAAHLAGMAATAVQSQANALPRGLASLLN